MIILNCMHQYFQLQLHITILYDFLNLNKLWVFLSTKINKIQNNLSLKKAYIYLYIEYINIKYIPFIIN